MWRRDILGDPAQRRVRRVRRQRWWPVPASFGALARGQWCERTQNPDAATSFSLRAFSGLDGDRAEAARQLQRAGGTAIHGLRALLHGEEDCQLAAIDGLIRLGATAELPRIVAAAASARPLVTNAAANAVHELYPHATALSRQATRAALAASTVLSLDILPIEVANDSAANLRMRGLMLLTIITAVVFGCWQRERSLLRLSSVPIT